MSDFLFQEFKPTSSASWKQKIQFDLNGLDYNQTVLTQTNEGIIIKPFYHSDSFEKIIIPQQKNEIKFCEVLVINDVESANKIANTAIEKGITAIKFISDKPFNISSLFDNLLNKSIDLHFHLTFLSIDFLTELSQFLEAEKVCFNIDPIGNLTLTGNWFNTLNTDFNIIDELLKNNNSKTLLSVNAYVYQNAGATTVQQVAYALAHANEYFLKFGSEVASTIQFNFAAGSNYFFEISKIRAFRYLLNLLLSEYAISIKPKIFSEPSLRNKTVFNHNVNKLRAKTENLSAILGGSTTISNIRHDFLFRNYDEKSATIARNHLLSLKEMEVFENEQEVASESYYIESITKQIAEKSLEIFKEIEKSGGFLAQLKEGTIQRKIAESAKKEQMLFDHESLLLVGTNKYQNTFEQVKIKLELNPFVERKSNKTLIIPVIPKRLSEKLEHKRLKNET